MNIEELKKLRKEVLFGNKTFDSDVEEEYVVLWGFNHSQTVLKKEIYNNMEFVDFTKIIEKDIEFQYQYALLHGSDPDLLAPDCSSGIIIKRKYFEEKFEFEERGFDYRSGDIRYCKPKKGVNFEFNAENTLYNIVPITYCFDYGTIDNGFPDDFTVDEINKLPKKLQYADDGMSISGFVKWDEFLNRMRNLDYDIGIDSEHFYGNNYNDYLDVINNLFHNVYLNHNEEITGAPSFQIWVDFDKDNKNVKQER